MAPKTFKDIKDGHISDYFSKEHLHSRNAKVEPEEEEDSEEWFIEDGPPKDTSRVIFVRPGHDDGTKKLKTKAS